MRRNTCFSRIEQVERSYQTALQTVRVLIRLAEDQPKYLRADNLSLKELRSLPGELHDLYFVRIFACFESDLRHYWQTIRKRKKQPPTEQLLSSIARRLRIPEDILGNVQRIREFRNSLIHEQHEVREPMTIDESIGDLRTYLAAYPWNGNDRATDRVGSPRLISREGHSPLSPLRPPQAVPSPCASPGSARGDGGRARPRPGASLRV